MPGELLLAAAVLGLAGLLALARPPARRVSSRPPAKRAATKRPTAPAEFRALKAAITEPEIAHLKRLPYAEFLRTEYWRIVRRYVLHRAGGRCSLCSEREGLQVHHRSYRHARGGEHQHLSDLVVLCRPCHARHHDTLNQRRET